MPTRPRQADLLSCSGGLLPVEPQRPAPTDEKQSARHFQDQAGKEASTCLKRAYVGLDALLWVYWKVPFRHLSQRILFFLGLTRFLLGVKGIGNVIHTS